LEQTGWIPSVLSSSDEAVPNSCKEAAVQVVAAAGINDAFQNDAADVHGEQCVRSVERISLPLALGT
jgi:hypothetical protein